MADGTSWWRQLTLKTPWNWWPPRPRALAHAKLLELGLCTVSSADFGHFADLLTVVAGFGIQTANSVVSETTLGGFDENVQWHIQSRGWMTMPMFGYALGRFSWERGVSRPAWTRHLRADVRAPFKKTLRWLQQGGD